MGAGRGWGGGAGGSKASPEEAGRRQAPQATSKLAVLGASGSEGGPVVAAPESEKHIPTEAIL